MVTISWCCVLCDEEGGGGWSGPKGSGENKGLGGYQNVDLKI